MPARDDAEKYCRSMVESETVQQAWRIPSKLPAARSSEKACSPLTAPPPDGGDTVMGGILALGAGAGDGADEDPGAAPESEALRLIPGAPDAVEASQVRSPDPPAPALPGRPGASRVTVVAPPSDCRPMRNPKRPALSTRLCELNASGAPRSSSQRGRASAAA